MYAFFVQQTPSRAVRSEERVQQLMRMWNVLLSSHKEAQKRHLAYYTPRTVSLTQYVRLVEDPDHHLSLEDVLLRHCRERNVIGEQAVMFAYKARLEEALQLRKGQPIDAVKRRREVFDMIRRQLVGSEVLSRYVLASFPDHTAHWLFRRQFTAQLALASLAAYVLSLAKGAPHTFRFVLGSGDIVPWEAAPAWDAAGRLGSEAPDGEIAANSATGSDSDHVPFRLTPNLVNFVTPSGITGVFSGAMVAAAQALQAEDGHNSALLGAVLRDEIIGWHAHHREPFHRAGVDNATLSAHTTDSVARVDARLSALATFSGAFTPVDRLIKEATASNNLCSMPATWQPWL